MKSKKALAGPTLVPWKGRPREALQRAERGRYGVVRLTGGRFRGKLGLYDDDEGGVVFVYPWGPPPAEYIVCRASSIARATDDEVELWWAVNGNQIATRLALREHERRLKQGE
jgi:hypothetical protein